MIAKSIKAELRRVASGTAHHSVASRPTAVQRCVMVASSLLYLLCAWTWLHRDHPKLGRLFFLVTTLSVTADGLSDLLPSPPYLSAARVADRVVGACALILSVVFNCTTLTHGILALIAAATALCLLMASRWTAKNQPSKRWRYVMIHAAWHAYGAFALCVVTIIAQQHG